MSYFKKYLQPFYSEDDGVNLSGNEPEVAEPDTSDTDIDSPDTEEGEKETEPAEPSKQSAEDNAKYAAARRESERIAKEAQQKAAKLERDNLIARKYSAEWGVYSEEDIRNKFGSEGITTFEEFEKAVHEKELRDAGIDPNIINQAVSNHPAVKQAEQYTEYLKQQQQQEFFKSAIEELHKEVPGTDHIKSIADLDKDPKSGEIAQWISRGYTVADAYYKVYKNDILGKSTKNAVQSTIANMQDKAKRGMVTNDADTDTMQADLSEFGSGLTAAFGLNPKNVAKRISQKLKG